jgi:hypothetical protein
LTCRLNGTTAYYKTSTKTQIQHKTNKKKKILQEKKYKSIGAKPVYSEKTQLSLFKNVHSLGQNLF